MTELVVTDRGDDQVGTSRRDVLLAIDDDTRDVSECWMHLRCATSLGFNPRRGVLQRMAEAVDRERVENDAQGIGLAADCLRSGREDALACR